MENRMCNMIIKTNNIFKYKIIKVYIYIDQFIMIKNLLVIKCKYICISSIRGP